MRLTAEHERFRRERPQSPNPAELAAIRQLTTDLPALWRAPTTTNEERQTIVRLLLERVLLTVVDNSEQVRLECHWHGGSRTTHMLVRPVARVKALSTYAALLARATDLHRAGNGFASIAGILNQETWRPPKRRDTFNAPMVRRLLTTAGVIEPTPRGPRALPERQADEWTIRELAAELALPQPTLYNWVRAGHLRSRSVSAGASSAKLVTADAATIARLKTIRATPPPWRRLSPPVLEVGRDWFNDRRPEPPPVAGPVGHWFSPGRDPIVSRHSDGIPYPMPGPRPQGDRALTSAERMRRLREKRKAEAADGPPEKPPVVIRYRRPKDRRSRPDQWADAINTLTDCLERYQEWRDNLPASLADSALAERLDAVLELRDLVDQLSLAELPRGFGRD